jgi:hypothetical protein
MTDENYRRKLAAILNADFSEYSMLMGNDEGDTVPILVVKEGVTSVLIYQHQY